MSINVLSSSECEIPLECFTYKTSKNVLEELYKDRDIKFFSNEDFLNLKPTEAYLNNKDRIAREEKEKKERAELDAKVCCTEQIPRMGD
jgi:hypothetical protein